MHPPTLETVPSQAFLERESVNDHVNDHDVLRATVPTSSPAVSTEIVLAGEEQEEQERDNIDNYNCIDNDNEEEEEEEKKRKAKSFYSPNLFPTHCPRIHACEDELDTEALSAVEAAEEDHIRTLLLTRSMCSQVDDSNSNSNSISTSMEEGEGSQTGSTNRQGIIFRRCGSEGNALEQTVGNRTVVARLRKTALSSVANPYRDHFAQRIPHLEQMSLSYGGDECRTPLELSVARTPQKEKGKKRSLTLKEKEVFAQEGRDCYYQLISSINIIIIINYHQSS